MNGIDNMSIDPFELLVSFLPFIIVFIVTYVIEFKLIRKIDFLWNKKKKIERAKKLGQVVTGTLKGRARELVTDGEPVLAKYEYYLNGVKRSKVVNFGSHIGRSTVTHPEKISIYYLGLRTYTEYDTSSVMDGVMGLLMFFGAGYEAITIQSFINMEPLLLIEPDIEEILPTIQSLGIGITVFLIICIILSLIYQMVGRKL